MLAIATATIMCVGAPAISLAKPSSDSLTHTVEKKKIVKKKIVKKRVKKHQKTLVQNTTTVKFIPTAPLPTETKVPVKYHYSTKKKPVVAEVEKCQFLFWEVPCNRENDETKTTISSNHRSVPVNKGMAMIGLNARKDREKLRTYFESKIEMTVDPVRTPWCAAFANSVLASSGFGTTASLAARSFLNYGTPTKNPEEGDIVVFSRGKSNWAGHVGFYMNTVTLNGHQYVAVLGGNQGKGVNIAYYPASKVLGYRKPVHA
jgi:uncharacterized protein (TIGR02594 family)